MAKIVELPRLSDTMEEGVIAKWHIKEGDKVKRGQVIADVETDKATMEFESFDAGVVLKLVASEGEPMPIGTPIAVLGAAGEDVDAALAARGGPSKKANGKPEATATAEPAQKAQPEPAQKAEPEPEAAEADALGPEVRPTDARIAASPVARRIARERGVDLANVRGSGPHGRIVKADVESAPTGAAARPAVSTTAGERTFVSRPDAPMKLSQMRKAIARRMAQANAEIPHFYLTAKIDMDRAVALRTEVNDALEGAGAGVKVSFNDLVILAVTKALKSHPEVNAYWNGETIVRRGDIHVGMAVAVDEGLIVPPIRFTDQKSLREIAAEARDLGTRGRDKQLKPDEMTGSTFTVSNLGMFGIDEFSAVINPGEGAILAVGSIIDEVVSDGGGGFRVGKRMKITLACDHRVMDGAIGAKFLGTVRGYLERPLSMLA